MPRTLFLSIATASALAATGSWWVLLAAEDAERHRAAMQRGAEAWLQGGCIACHNAQVPGGRLLHGLSGRYSERDLLELFAVPPANMPEVTLPQQAQRDLALWLLATHP